MVPAALIPLSTHGVGIAVEARAWQELVERTCGSAPPPPAPPPPLPVPLHDAPASSSSLAIVDADSLSLPSTPRSTAGPLDL
eukprot:4453180-Pyramimonas_sp.AAC.1